MPPFRSDCSWFDQIGFQPQSERQGSRTCPAPIPPVFSKKQLRRKINVIFQKNARSENPEPRLSERRAKKTKRERTHKACFGFSIRNTRHASARHGTVRTSSTLRPARSPFLQSRKTRNRPVRTRRRASFQDRNLSDSLRPQRKTEEDSQGKANLPENNEGTEMVPYLRLS